MKKIKITWGPAASINWAVKTEKGYEIWEEQVSYHSYKTRNYEPKLVETISVKEFENRQEKSRLKREAAKKAKERRQKLRSKTFPCPSCGRETNEWDAEMFEGELICYDCFDGMCDE